MNKIFLLGLIFSANAFSNTTHTLDFQRDYFGSNTFGEVSDSLLSRARYEAWNVCGSHEITFSGIKITVEAPSAYSYDSQEDILPAYPKARFRAKYVCR